MSYGTLKISCCLIAFLFYLLSEWYLDKFVAEDDLRSAYQVGFFAAMMGTTIIFLPTILFN